MKLAISYYEKSYDKQLVNLDESIVSRRYCGHHHFKVRFEFALLFDNVKEINGVHILSVFWMIMLKFF